MTMFENMKPGAPDRSDGSAIKLAVTPDDSAMLRAAAELTRDINVARPTIYWSDFLASAALGYGD